MLSVLSQLVSGAISPVTSADDDHDNDEDEDDDMVVDDTRAVDAFTEKSIAILNEKDFISFFVDVVENGTKASSSFSGQFPLSSNKYV